MEELGSPLNPDENSVLQAINASDSSQDLLFGVVEEYDPKRRNEYIDTVGQVASSTVVPFRQVIETFLEDDEVEDEEKAHLIANFFDQTHSARTSHFSDIAPEADLIELEPHAAGMTVVESLTVNIQQALEDDDTSHEEIVNGITSRYADFLSRDCVALAEELSSYTTLLGYLRSVLAENVPEVGKTATGVAIGGIIAGLVLRRFSK